MSCGVQLRPQNVQLKRLKSMVCNAAELQLSCAELRLICGLQIDANQGLCAASGSQEQQGAARDEPGSSQGAAKSRQEQPGSNQEQLIRRNAARYDQIRQDTDKYGQIWPACDA